MRATFKGGYTIGFYKADVAIGDAQEVWHNQPNDKIVANIDNARLAGDILVFPFAVAGRRRGGGRGGRGGGKTGSARNAGHREIQATPVDEWDRYYALNVMDTAARPVLLTTTDGLIENQTSDRAFGRREDFLLLHQRQRHRAAAYLGRTGEGRRAGADHRGRRRGDVSRSSSLRQIPRDAEREIGTCHNRSALEDGL